MTPPARSHNVGEAVFSPTEPLAERLIHMFVGLATELAVTRERLDTLERMLAERGVVEDGALDGYVPDAAAEAERQRWRDRFLDQVFENLQAEIDAASEKPDRGW